MDTQPFTPSPAGAPPADVSNTTPGSSAPPIGSGGPGASVAAQIEANVAAATRAAIADYNSGLPVTGKRGNGQRGPDKRPRKNRPSGSVARPAGVAGDAVGPSPDAFGAEGDAFGLDPEPAAPEPVLDEKTLEFLAEGLTGLLEDIGTGLVRRVALAETRDAALAKEAAKTAVMSERTRKLIIHGAIECAKKYSVDTAYGPEACLIGGIGFYGVGIALAVRELKSHRKEEPPKPGTSPAAS